MDFIPAAVATGVGLLGTIFGGNSSRKQYDEILNNMMKIAQENRNRQIQMAMPYYQAGQEGLQYTRNFTNEMNRKRFMTNPYYDQERQTSLNEANRQIAQLSKSSAYAFSNNQGRARGEQARVGRQGIIAKNSINLNWARKTEQERMNNTQMYLTGLSQLNQMGYTGTNIMSRAYDNFSQQAMGITGQKPIDSTWETLGGTVLGFGIDGLQQYFNQNKPKPKKPNNYIGNLSSVRDDRVFFPYEG